LRLAGDIPLPLKTMTLLGLYGLTFMVWSKDASIDLNKTMAALDKNLSRAEHLAKLTQTFRAFFQPGRVCLSAMVILGPVCGMGRA